MKRTFAVLLVVMALAVACHTDAKAVKFADTSVFDFGGRLHALKIGEQYEFSDFEKFLRVPGGWVYNSKAGYGESACFIPYSSEGTGEGVPARVR